jgi:hypothetical protein
VEKQRSRTRDLAQELTPSTVRLGN